MDKRRRSRSRLQIPVVVLAILSSAGAGFGLATEQIGPDSAQSHTAQPGWPAGIIELLGHDSRVFPGG